MIDPCVVVVVHPVNVVGHPTYPKGYRWAVMFGSRQPSDLRYCMGAGHARSLSEASVVGESHGSAVCKSVRLCGMPATYSFVSLDFDPIPAEADNIPLGEWR